MASPQKENGYTAIANQIMEALCRIRINGEARQCLDFILRKTYGYNKKEDKISLSQFVLATGLKKPTICKAINKLIYMKLIIQIDNDDINIYRFNKDFDGWEPLPKKITLPKKIMTFTQKDNESLPKKIPTIVDNTKDNITKVDIAETSSAEVIPDLLKDKQKHIQIIGLYAKAKKITFTSKEHQSSFIRRNLKAAKNLTPYKIDRTIQVMAWLIKNADFKFTLESVGKYIDEDLYRLNNKNSNIVVI